MNTLWIFNPDNDIALGNNLKHFTPPRNAMLLRQYGAMLPAWIANAGDIIYTDNPTDATWLCDISNHIGKEMEILTPDNSNHVKQIKPWGWSRAVVDTFLRRGISSNLLPNDEQIERIRQLSHRRTSIIINRKLQDAGFEVPIPVEFTDTGALSNHISSQRSIVIKSPWSSSGRGVIYSERRVMANLLRQADGIINSQGSVLVEPYLDKIIDFAMLFNISEGIAKYVGLSVFETLAGGNYTGNIVASEQQLASIITRYVSLSYLERLQREIGIILTELISNAYNGICGIDMMVYSSADGTNRIAPCVELNLRYTMGYIAHCLARDIIAPEKTGKMLITYIGNRDYFNKGNRIPPQISNDNRLINGTLNLIPTNPYFSITLTV